MHCLEHQTLLISYTYIHKKKLTFLKYNNTAIGIMFINIKLPLSVKKKIVSTIINVQNKRESLYIGADST